MADVRLPSAGMPLVLAQTTTTEVLRVVGDPLPAWIPWTAGIVLLVVILLVGRWLSRRAG